MKVSSRICFTYIKRSKINFYLMAKKVTSKKKATKKTKKVVKKAKKTAKKKK